MEPHPIRVVVTDDRLRSRLTVFFRLILAIPHFIWLFLWSIAVFFAVIANWVATLVQGISPRGLHNFLAAYVRYATQFYAYLYLAANPYPSFDGSPGYPVDVEIDGPAPQNRWKVAFRLFLALPALFLAAVLASNGWGSGGSGGSGRQADETATWASASLSVAVTVAILAWFAILVRGRMPRGFRDLQAYVLRYGAQAWGYLLLLTDRYPDANTEEPRPVEPVPPHPVRLVLTDDGARSRLTVFFRLLLILPHLVWLVLWALAAYLLAIPVWVVVLVRARMPDGLHRFYSAFVRYGTHVGAFGYLIANPFPGFTGTPGYPVDLEIDAPERQNRWVVGFRFLLALPALLVLSALGGAVFLVALFGWFVSLALGRMPVGLRNLGAYVLRYSGQVYAYALLLTDRYPDSGPTQHRAEDDEARVEPSLEPAA
ncbi:MAG TPA: DUF4389 domain-containing protein [Gaiellaceae bacterium]|nr:DUF4389 domain-containing protein [Gaiellaceae bacterium]